MFCALILNKCSPAENFGLELLFLKNRIVNLMALLSVFGFFAFNQGLSNKKVQEI